MNEYKGKKTLAVITARGGSKGIPGKNIKILSGKPLIAYTIEAAKESKFLSRAILSTDSEEIIAVSKQFNADVPFVRPAELALDTTPHMPVLQHALNWLKENKGESYDYLLILQPTSPLRSAEDIDECIKLIVDTDADSVMSMKQMINFTPHYTKKIEDGVIAPFFDFAPEGKQSGRRQDQVPAYMRNCAIFLTKVSLIMENDLFGKVSRGYVMPPERSVDVDTPIDFEMVEFLMTKNKTQ